MAKTRAHSTIIPCLRYRNAHVALDWLCDAFGFHRHAVYANERIVHHAQLTFDGGMVMIGSADDDGEWGRHAAQPDEIDGRETQTCCVVVEAIDEHCEKAKAAGAEIVIDIADQEYGGRGYACRDIEGHLWWFGSYDPWQPPAADHDDGKPAA